jgi:hypothetical protein
VSRAASERCLPRVITIAVITALGSFSACMCSKRELGEECIRDAQCVAGYVCFRGVCTTAGNKHAALTTQSGVGSAPSERPSVGGQRVRVRATNGEGLIFAKCEATERLVGGGCKGGDNCASESACTLGGRWICSGAEGTLQAFALCQEAPRDAPSTVPTPTLPDAGVPADAP